MNCFTHSWVPMCYAHKLSSINIWLTKLSCIVKMYIWLKLGEKALLASIMWIQALIKEKQRKEMKWLNEKSDL